MQIDAHTSLYGVFGNPVSHSLSPVMQQSAFDAHGLNAVYLAFCIEDIALGVSAVRTLGIKGVSVTIPHKVSVMPFLDEIDDLARRIGAVNTIVNRDGRLVGYNTDCHGAVEALSEKTEIKGRTVAIIGAGGAARAVGFGVREAGGKVTIYNRTPEKGKRLADDLGVSFQPFSQIAKSADRIVINTTSLGMHPNIDASPLSDSHFDKGMAAMDIVYNPLKTRFLETAEKSGAVIVDGLSMFVHQGAVQFKLWTGKTPPFEQMKASVVKILNKTSTSL